MCHVRGRKGTVYHRAKGSASFNPNAEFASCKWNAAHPATVFTHAVSPTILDTVTWDDGLKGTS